jgi:F-type H+-transporting ATPase subunit epsilon
MKLFVITPFEEILDVEATKVVAPGAHGSFCFLPRHADGVWGLKIGILDYIGSDGLRAYVGLNSGIMVKSGHNLWIATNDAVVSENLEQLRSVVDQRFHKISDDERRAQSALARLEAGLVRRLVDLERRNA